METKVKNITIVISDLCKLDERFELENRIGPQTLKLPKGFKHNFISNVLSLEDDEFRNKYLFEILEQFLAFPESEKLDQLIFFHAYNEEDEENDGRDPPLIKKFFKLVEIRRKIREKFQLKARCFIWRKYHPDTINKEKRELIEVIKNTS